MSNAKKTTPCSHLVIFLLLISGIWTALSGCGGGNTGQGALPDSATQAASSSGPAGGGGHLVGVWKVDVDVAGEKMTFTALDPAQAGVAASGSRFHLEDANVNLGGSATWAAPTLSGNVTLTNNGVDKLYFPMVTVTQINDAGVTVANEDFQNGGNPTWKYGSLASGGSRAVEWQFSDPGGVNFSFTVHVFAWAAQTGVTSNDLHAVQFIDPNTGITVGDNATILRTSDGGVNWNPAASFPWVNNLLGVSMVDANTAWVVGENDVIWKTTDGGVNWIDNSPLAWGVTYEAISCADSNHGIAVGENNAIVYTTNGTAWYPASNQAAIADLHGITMLSSTRAVVVGAGGAIWITDDGGDNWIAQVSGTTEPLYGVSFIDANNGTVVGYDIILHTTDGGTTWTTVRATPWDQNWHMSVKMLNANEAWVAGTNYGINYYMLYHIDYTDNSVVGIYEPAPPYLFGIGFGGDPANGDGWVVGSGGAILH